MFERIPLIRLSLNDLRLYITSRIPWTVGTSTLTEKDRRDMANDTIKALLKSEEATNPERVISLRNELTFEELSEEEEK